MSEYGEEEMDTAGLYADLSQLLGEECEHPSTTRARKLAQALWEYFSDGNGQIGDARTVGFAVTVEMEDTSGNRWIRHAASSGEGNILPPWQVKGYLHDALSFTNTLYERLAIEPPERSEE